MPVLDKSSYVTPLFLRNGHVNTFFSSVMRKLEEVCYERERILTPDQDFIDLDWSRVANSRNCVVLSHGLEGSSRSPYIQGMVSFFNSLGWDAVCWNHRGCSGEPNKTEKLYHSGCSEDLDTVLKWIQSRFTYDNLSLIGFSLGGNVILKYLGETGRNIMSQVRSAVCFSVPCDLKDSAEKLATPSNQMYMRVFLRSLKKKLEEKLRSFPGLFSFEAFEHIKNFFQFDEHFTAPLHGYENAEDYYKQCSAKGYLESIAIPTLLVSAKDDPMLGTSCFPIEEARKSENLYLELPEHGGHAGFCSGSATGIFWSEQRAAEFIREKSGI